MKIKKKIVLIGMMGSGKSTIGALLSKKMNMKFIDLDQKIEAIEKQTISELEPSNGLENFGLQEEGSFELFDNSKETQNTFS